MALWLKVAAGVGAGSGIGWAYYRFIGCSTGTCPITSNPWASMIYGGLIGLLLTLR